MPDDGAKYFVFAKNIAQVNCISIHMLGNLDTRVNVSTSNIKNTQCDAYSAWLFFTYFRMIKYSISERRIIDFINVFKTQPIFFSYIMVKVKTIKQSKSWLQHLKNIQMKLSLKVFYARYEDRVTSKSPMFALLLILLFIYIFMFIDCENNHFLKK